MGCGFSHRVEPNTIGEPGSELVVNGNGGNSFVGNGLANSTLNATASAVPPAKGSPLSFIVPIRDKEDPKEVSLIRRHPPVRLRRLEEEQQVHRAKLTLDELERRQAEAEERRRKVRDFLRRHICSVFSVKNIGFRNFVGFGGESII